MYDLALIRPYRTTGKIRIGKRGDGGYVLTQRLIDATTVLLSFGISDDWSFEEDLCTRKRVNAYLFDIVVSHSWHFRRVIRKAKLLKPIATWRVLKIWVLFALFTARRGVRYRQVGIAHRAGQGYVDFEEVFTDVLRNHRLDGRQVLLKIDVEGAEYDVVEDLEPHLPHVAGLAIEVHALGEKGEEFEALVRFLRRHGFFPCHVHGNNIAPLLPASSLPGVLEVTFLHEQLFSHEVVPDTSLYPIPGLDEPNNPFVPDFILDFSRP